MMNFTSFAGKLFQVTDKMEKKNDGIKLSNDTEINPKQFKL